MKRYTKPKNEKSTVVSFASQEKFHVRKSVSEARRPSLATHVVNVFDNWHLLTVTQIGASNVYLAAQKWRRPSRRASVAVESLMAEPNTVSPRRRANPIQLPPRESTLIQPQTSSPHTLLVDDGQSDEKSNGLQNHRRSTIKSATLTAVVSTIKRHSVCSSISKRKNSNVLAKSQATSMVPSAFKRDSITTSANKRRTSNIGGRKSLATAAAAGANESISSIAGRLEERRRSSNSSTKSQTPTAPTDSIKSASKSPASTLSPGRYAVLNSLASPKRPLVDSDKLSP